MEGSQNQHTQPLSGRRRADFAVEQIDEFFRTEELLTEEDRLRAGLMWAEEHGFMSAAERLECERLGHISLINKIAPVTETDA